MPHNRKLGLCGVSLTTARCNQHDLPVMSEIQNEVEALMISSGFLQEAPFKWVTLALRYGLKYEDEPHYMRVNKKYGDLPLGIELDTHDLRDADRDKLKRIFTLATLRSLIHAGKKYNLPTAALEQRRDELLVNDENGGGG